MSKPGSELWTLSLLFHSFWSFLLNLKRFTGQSQSYPTCWEYFSYSPKVPFAVLGQHVVGVIVQGVLNTRDMNTENDQEAQIEHKAPQRALLLAIEGGNILEVRQALSRIPTSKRSSVLLAHSKKPEHQLRTPLMAAAASGNWAIFGESSSLNDTWYIALYV